jgi:hypothetical protein
VFNGGPAHAQHSTNEDLFNELYQLTIDKRILLKVRWMPAHLKDSDRWPHDVSRKDICSNRHADKHAGLAAIEFQLPREVASPVIKYSGIVSKIQKRLATIIMNLPGRGHRPTAVDSEVTSPPRMHLETLLNNTTHTISIDTSRVSYKYECAKCNTGFTQRDPSLKYWLECPCPGRHDRAIPIFTHNEGEDTDDELVVAPPQPPASSCMPVPIVSESIRIGNQYVHSTHRMTSYRGLEYCNICYFKVTHTTHGKQIRKLAQPCVGRPTDSTSSSARFKYRIEHNILPVGFKKWPDEQ